MFCAKGLDHVRILTFARGVHFVVLLHEFLEHVEMPLVVAITAKHSMLKY